MGKAPGGEVERGGRVRVEELDEGDALLLEPRSGHDLTDDHGGGGEGEENEEVEENREEELPHLD